MFGDLQIADRMQIHRNGVCQGLGLGTGGRILGQEAQIAGLVEVIKNGERLGQPQTVDIQNRYKSLRDAGQMFGGLLLTLDQIDSHRAIVDPSKIERNSQTIAGR